MSTHYVRSTWVVCVDDNTRELYNGVTVIIECVCIYECILYFVVLYVCHHMTRPGSILRGVQIYLKPARVRIWAISIVIVPNKHKSCMSCSSRTGPTVTAKIIT